MLCSDEEVLFKKMTKIQKQNKTNPCQSSFYFLFEGMEILTELLFLK